MAYDSITSNNFGLMTAIADGKFAMVPIPDPKLGPRKVDIEKMFNTDRYRPTYTSKVGLPVFLTHA
jgi:6-phosphofructokinase 1